MYLMLLPFVIVPREVASTEKKSLRMIAEVVSVRGRVVAMLYFAAKVLIWSPTARECSPLITKRSP